MSGVFGSFYNWANRHGRAIALVGSVFWTVAGGAVTAWAAWAASVFYQYAPFSWVIAGLLGALASSGILALFGYFRARLAQAQALEFAKKPPTTVNPLRNNFEREKINLSDFWAVFQQTKHYKNVVFRQCDIYGPGSMILWHNTRLNSCSFIACDLVLAESFTLYTGVIFEEVVYDQCKFINIVLFLSRNAAEALIQSANPQGEKPTIIGY